MNNIEKYDELIEKFLSGNMTSEEEASFKEELKANPELKEHAKVVSSLIMGMKRKKEKDDAEIIEEIQEKEAFRRVAASRIDGGNNRFSAKIFLWAASIAAVCIFMFNIFNSTGNKESELFGNYYSEYSCESLSRGDEDSLVVAQLSEMFNGIKDAEDCTGTVKSLEAIYNNLDKEYKYRAYANDIAWYLALAYIKNNQTAEAEKVLAKLVEDNPDTEIADKAQKLLNDIKENK
ncbi:MAG: hypothetical protein MJZ37_09395 [Bacilli bacterium]|nr:hypothetical protein [Bacilli bacterium]